MLDENVFKKIIGKNIKKKREEKGWTQAELSEKLSVSIRHISRLETGKSGIAFNTLIDLCNIFDTTPGWFFGEGENKEATLLFNTLNKENQETIIKLMENLI